MFAAGLTGAGLLFGLGLDSPARLDGNAFWHLGSWLEPPILILQVVVLATIWWVARGTEPRGDERTPEWRGIALVAAGAGLVSVLGAWVVFFGHALSGDEQSVVFLAELFARGQVEQQVPRELWGVAPALAGPFMGFHPDVGTIRSTYLPMYAAIRTPFHALGIGPATNGFLVIVTVLGAARVAGNVATPRAAWTTALLTAGSAQILISGMTAYSMAGHLALNTVWLALYTDRRAGVAFAAPIVGVIALGLHNPVVHGLFAAPFLLRMVTSRRWGLASWSALLYVVALVFWSGWLDWGYPDGLAATATSPWRFPSQQMMITQFVAAGMIGSWQAGATVALAAVGAWTWRSQPVVIRDAALSFLLSWGLMVFYLEPQGNGWGYRYVHGVLINVVLLAAVGLEWLRAELPSRPWSRVLALTVFSSLLVLLPARSWMTRSYVEPFARTQAWLRAQPEDLLVLDPIKVWYGTDLIRNEVGLAHPLVASSRSVPPARFAELEAAGWTVRRITVDELKAQGMSPFVGATPR